MTLPSTKTVVFYVMSLFLIVLNSVARWIPIVVVFTHMFRNTLVFSCQSVTLLVAATSPACCASSASSAVRWRWRAAALLAREL